MTNKDIYHLKIVWWLADFRLPPSSPPVLPSHSHCTISNSWIIAGQALDKSCWYGLFVNMDLLIQPAAFCGGPNGFCPHWLKWAYSVGWLATLDTHPVDGIASSAEKQVSATTQGLAGLSDLSVRLPVPVHQSQYGQTQEGPTYPAYF